MVCTATESVRDQTLTIVNATASNRTKLSARKVDYYDDVTVGREGHEVSKREADALCAISNIQ